MLIQESINIGLKELWANKTRTALSVLGIIIGIVSLIVMMAIMTGMEVFWHQYIDEIGGIEKAVLISKTPTKDGDAREDLKREITLDDAKIMKAQSHIVRYVSPEIPVMRQLSYRGKKRHYERVVGGNRDTLKIEKQIVSRGRTLSAEDVAKNRHVCVIGATIRDKLFGPRINPVGETIDINGLPFDVIGLLETSNLTRRGRNILEFKNKVAYIPVTTMQKKFGENMRIQQIQYVVKNRKDIGRAKRDLSRLVDKNHRFAGDTEIKTQEDRFEKSKKSFELMKLNFSIIAGISLVVGGIGIMNIMIATVAQRLVEIGIRKAVGAKFKDILLQFLMESVIISGLGGLAGITFSFVVVFVIGKFSAEAQPVIGWDAVLLASSFSVLVGICFGLYPAFKAAKLNPIDALRFQ